MSSHHPAGRAEESAKTFSPINPDLRNVQLPYRPLLHRRPCFPALTMAARQRLQAILDARRASQPCWRCALDFARCSSTSPTGIQESSTGKNRVSYEHLPQQKIDDGLTTASPDIHSINASVYAQSATRSSDEPDGSVSQTAHEPPIRRMWKHQTVGSRIASQLQVAGVDGKPLVRRIRFLHPHILIASEGRPVALAPQSQSNTSRASHKSGTRRAIKSRAPRKVLAKSAIRKSLSIDRLSPIKWKVLHFGLPTKDKDKGMIRKTLTTNNSIYHWESRSPINDKDKGMIRKTLTTNNSIYHWDSRLSKGPPNATQVPSESQPKDEVFLAELTSLMDSIRVSSSNLPPINTETGDSVSSPRSSPRYHARQSTLTYSRHSNKDSPKTLSLTRTSKAANRHYATAAVSKNRPLSVLNILKPCIESDFACWFPNRPTHHWNKPRWVWRWKTYTHPRGA